MANIYADLADVGFSAYQQGTAPEVLPEKFVTVWEDSSEDILHGDNKPRICRHDYTVIFYTTDPASVYDDMKTIIKALKKKGYTIGGHGYDAAGVWENYTSRAVDVVNLEYLEE